MGNRNRHGFTLIELLVVVSIIVLLMALLVPSLAGAKKVAKTAICAGNTRSICQVMSIYASEWDGAILGNGTTTARYMFNTQFTNWDLTHYTTNVKVPLVVQNWDWMSPMLAEMGTAIDLGATPSDRAQRYTAISSFKLFKCPALDQGFTGFFYSGHEGGLEGTYPLLPSVNILPSYCTAMMFQFNGLGASGGIVDYSSLNPKNKITLPDSYRPKVQLVGPPASKIFVADGARYSDTLNKPDLNLESETTDRSNQFTDPGACFQNSTSGYIQTHSWDRGLAPGNANPNGGTIDARIYAYRHGSTAQRGPSGNYKMNAGFFDGHAEVINDKDSANPALWMPTGTNLNPNGDGSGDATLQIDSKNNYTNGTSYTAP